MEPQRVQKFIAKSGYCSRRKAEELIQKGQVTVNNKIITLGDKCIETDIIKVKNKNIQYNLQDNIYIILNKKKGFITTKSDELNRKTVYDLLKPRDNKPNLFSVGRLDKDTTGLLILTNDGDFAQKIIHPSSQIFKEYIVQIDKPLKNKDKTDIEHGLILDDYKLSKCKIKRLSQQKYSILISEGRKRQVRRMFELKGYNVSYLHRIKIGNLDLKDFSLNLGQYKIVPKKELMRIFEH